MDAPQPKIILAGGTGFLGRHLTASLSAAGYSCVVLTRDPDTVPAPARGVKWDALTFTGWVRELDGAAAVINLTGRKVNCRQTTANRREILASRLNSVRALAEAVRRAPTRPPVWIQASSLAIYGDAGDLWCDETAPDGTGEAVSVCRQWEDTFFRAPLPDSVRRAALRIGFVLGQDGGALPVLAGLARRFLGGQAGSGRQFISWLHVADFCRIVHRILTDSTLSGVFNCCSAGPVTNREFMDTLRGVLERPWSPPVPAPLLRLGAWGLKSDGRLALSGRRGQPSRLLESGFRFEYPALQPALTDLLSARALPAPADALSPAPLPAARP